MIDAVGWVTVDPLSGLMLHRELPGQGTYRALCGTPIGGLARESTVVAAQCHAIPLCPRCWASVDTRP